MYYADPSGHYRNCVKEAYDRIHRENPDMPAQDAYNRALEEAGVERLRNDAAQNVEGNRPYTPEAEAPNNDRTLLSGEEWYQYFKDVYGAENVQGSAYNWSQADLQKAMDDIYLAGVNRIINPETGEMYNGGPRQTITVTQDGKVFISQNTSAVDSASRDMAQRIFGDDVTFIPGGKGTVMPDMPDDYGGAHAEAKGIYYLDSHGISTEGVKQVSSHYSCDSCQSVQRSNGVLNYTGYASDHGNVQKRIDYKSAVLGDNN